MYYRECFHRKIQQRKRIQLRGTSIRFGGTNLNKPHELEVAKKHDKFERTAAGRMSCDDGESHSQYETLGTGASFNQTRAPWACSALEDALILLRRYDRDSSPSGVRRYKSSVPRCSRT